MGCEKFFCYTKIKVLGFIVISLFPLHYASADEYTITIAGPDTAVDGSQYVAVGGMEPYKWSINKGSISQDGIVSISRQCGTATITVTDDCGNTATRDVTMPNGTWVLTEDLKLNTCNVPSNGNCTTISSDTKIVYSWYDLLDNWPCPLGYDPCIYSGLCYANNSWSSNPCTGASWPDNCCPAGGGYKYLSKHVKVKKQTYQWRCP